MGSRGPMRIVNLRKICRRETPGNLPNNNHPEARELARERMHIEATSLVAGIRLGMIGLPTRQAGSMKNMSLHVELGSQSRAKEGPDFPIEISMFIGVEVSHSIVFKQFCTCLLGRMYYVVRHFEK